MGKQPRRTFPWVLHYLINDLYYDSQKVNSSQKIQGALRVSQDPVSKWYSPKFLVPVTVSASHDNNIMIN